MAPTKKAINSKPLNQVVIAGGGIAGLAAAKVMSQFAKDVLIVDRDPESPGTIARRGVPQATHAHVLTARGYAALLDLFPGIQKRLDLHGVKPFDASAGKLVLYPDLGYLPQTPCGASTISASRGFLEACLVAELKEQGEIQVLNDASVLALETEGYDRIVSASIAHQGQQKRLMLDAYIDASGWRSNTPQLYAALGFSKTVETLVASGVWYASLWFKADTLSTKPPVPIFQVVARPGRQDRGAMVCYVEDGMVVATIGGHPSLSPPRTLADFYKFFATVAPISLQEILSTLTPLDARVQLTRNSVSRLRSFNRRGHFPLNAFTIGDAYLRSNPYYGLGLTATLMSAQTLQRSFATGQTAPQFHRELRHTLAPITNTVLALDRSWRGQAQTLAQRARQKIFEKILTAVIAGADTWCSKQFASVLQFMLPATNLTKPRFLWALWRSNQTKSR